MTTPARSAWQAGAMGAGGAVLVVGECLADMKPASGGASLPGGSVKQFVALPGGGPANIAVGLGRLSTPVAFAGRFATEGLGPWLWEHVEASGVDMSLSVKSCDPATIALVSIGDGGAATYAFYGPHTSDWQWSRDELPRATALTSHEPPVIAVHTGSLATAFEPSADIIRAWLEQLRRESPVAVSYDPNVRPGLISMDRMVSRVEEFVTLADLVKVSVDDMKALYPDHPVERVAQRWLDAGAAAIVVTMGAKGAIAWSRCGSTTNRPAPTVRVADTIGAGDSFMSALLAHLLRWDKLSAPALAALSEAELASALADANRASAITCTRPGADPPTSNELERFFPEVCDPREAG